MLSETMRYTEISGNSREAKVKVKAYNSIKQLTKPYAGRDYNFLKIALFTYALNTSEPNCAPKATCY